MFTRKFHKGISLIMVTAVLLSALTVQAGAALALPGSPVIYPDGGSFATAQRVNIGNIPYRDTAYYTTDGSSPSSSSTSIRYFGTFIVYNSETITAAVYDQAQGWSSPVTAIFTINRQNSLQPPVIYPDGGSFSTAQSVTIGSIPSGDTAYYTTDSSNPETSSTRITYSGAFTVSQSETVQAVNYNFSGWSSVVSAAFTISGSSSALQPPVIYPDGGSFSTAQSVTIGSIPSGDTAYYTTDGSDPTSSGTTTAYTGAFTVSQSETVQAAVEDSVLGWSSVASAAFTISGSSSALQPPVIYPDGGSFITAQSVTIGSIPSGDTAYYTTDGSDPTSSGTTTAYTGAFTVSQSETVQAAVEDSVLGWSSVASATFTIGNQPVAPGGNSSQIDELKQEFAAAIDNNQMQQAMQILQEIRGLTAENQNENKLNDLKQQLIDAVNNGQYDKAESLLLKILKLENSSSNYQQLGAIYQEEGKGQNPSVFYNGSNVQFSDVQPQIINSRCMIPIRGLANALGVNNDAISWNQDGAVNIQYGSDHLSLRVNQNTIYRNGDPISVDVSPQIVGNRMLVPVGAISRLLGKRVDWYQQGRIVSVES